VTTAAALLLLAPPALPSPARVGEFDAPAVGRRLTYAVLLPADYATSGRRYPVLYLLHGYTGNHTSWLTYAGLPPDTATTHGLIVVMPEAGNTFHVDGHGATDGRPHRWGEMIVGDLVRHVDAAYRTRADRSGRAVAGLSMGGCGAVALALRHPDRFAVAVSSGGALAVARSAAEELRAGKPDWNEPARWDHPIRPPGPTPGFATQAERTPPGKLFTTPEQAAGWNPFDLAGRADPKTCPHLHLDCGTADDGLPLAREFTDLLRPRKLPYSYLELPGGHAPPYWRDAARHWLLVVAEHLHGRGR
jgi:S-formylglutathione hydrolase